MSKFLVALWFAWPALAAVPNLNDYAQLPCATDAELKTLSARAKWTQLPEGKLCDGSRLAKAGKLLKLAERLDLTIPADWRGGARDALTSPMSYLAKMNRNIALDFKQATTIAYNRANGDVYLGALFFEQSPLDALMTLVHESRHSAASDPSHTLCRQGDIPFSAVGCDEWFRTDDSAGAYAYDASYGFGAYRYAPGLSRSDREFMLNSSLSIVGTRFNRVPAWLAVPLDVVRGLDEKGELFTLHPFLKTRIPLPEAKPKDEKITRVEFYNPTNGLAVFTESQLVYTWRPGKKVARWGKGLLDDKERIVDFGSLNNGKNTFRYFLNPRNELHYISTDEATGKRKVFASSLKLGDLTGRRIFSGGTDRRYVLTDTGRLNFYEDSQFKESNFNLTEAWSYATSGALYEEIFGLNGEGTLYYKGANGPDKSRFQTAGARKYVEGTTLRVLLDTRGDLKFSQIGADKDTELLSTAGNKIVDVAVTRNILASDRFGFSSRPNAKFAERCGLKVTDTDPWVEQGVGLTEDGRLFFEGENGACVNLALSTPAKWKTIAFSEPRSTERAIPFLTWQWSLPTSRERNSGFARTWEKRSLRKHRL